MGSASLKEPVAARMLRFVRFGIAVAVTIACQRAIAADPAVSPSRAALSDPLAEIRLLRAGHVGDTLDFESIGQNVPEAKLSWDLESRPKLSKAKISDHHSDQVSVLADVPGVYVVRLTVRVRNLSATATLSASATYPGPLVALNTISLDSQGRPEMLVGSSPYPDPGKGTGLHVLVLDRNSLEYQTDYSVALTSSGISQMQSNFQNMEAGSALVLVSLPASAGAIPSSLIAPLNAALNEIGAALPERWVMGPNQAAAVTECWSSNQMACGDNNASWQQSNSYVPGSFSVIGVPGMTIGNAWYDDAIQRGTTNGALIGYLTPGVTVGGGTYASAYTFVFGADQYVIVDSCVSGAPSACVISVNGELFAPQAGVNGMNVVLVDRVTLRTLAHQTVSSTTALHNLLNQPVGPTSGHYFLGQGTSGFISDRIVVVMQSVGNGKLTYDAATPTLQNIDQLGGTPETFGPAIMNGKPYALIGVAGTLPWHGKGIESSTVIAPQQSGRSRGVLYRDRVARYTPSANDPSGTANLDLFPIIYENPQAWPYADTDACSINYIADQIGVGASYPDIRSGYSGNLDITWTNFDLDKVVYPGSLQTYCNPIPSQDEFKSIKDELTSEFGWVEGVKGWITNLKSPFIETQSSGENIVVQAANTVYQTVKPPPQSTTSTSWLTVFNAIMPFVTVAVPESEPALSMISATGTLATDMMSTSKSTADPANQVIAEAIDLAQAMSDQLDGHLASLGRLEVILLSDYGKLSAVGTNLPTSAWAWGPNSTSDAVNALNATTQQTAYSALIPPSWPLVELKPDLITWFTSSDVKNFRCYHHSQDVLNDPFAAALQANQLSSLWQLITGIETSTTEIWTFAKYDPDSFGPDDKYTAYVPTTSLTDTLFSLQADGAAAYPPAWYRSTFNPPDFVRCGATYSNPSTEQHPAPTIPPQEAGYTMG